jgi:hypothetical protein
VLTPMLPHLVLLVGPNPEIRARLAGTQQYESGLPILGKVADGIRLIYFSRFEQCPSAGETPSLVAERGQDNSSLQRCVPDVLVSPHTNHSFSFGRDQVYVIGWDFRFHFKESKSSMQRF